MFKKLKDFFRQPTPTGRFLNLTDAQFLALKRLSTESDYRIWLDALDLRGNLISEQLLAAGDPFKLAQLQGTLNGLRIAASLVDEALLHEAHAENERSRTREKPVRDPAAANRSLFGTPAGSAHFKR